MGVAYSLFEELNEVSDLVRLVDLIASESLHLEFKRKRDAHSFELTDGTDFVLSKAIGGFANSDGGVLIIGIDAPSGDSPLIKAPIKNVSKFEARVNEYISRATSFPVEGIIVKKIIEDISLDLGYIVLLIPQSDMAPHRSMKQGEYFQRIGESFLKMEHYQLADMFGKRHAPKLVPYALLEGDSSGRGTVNLTIGLRNNGKAIAKFPFFKFITFPGFSFEYYGIDGNANWGLPRFPSSTNYKEYRGGVNDVIPSMSELPITKLKRIFQTSPSTNVLIEGFEDVTLQGLLAAEAFSEKIWKIVIQREKFQQVISNRGLAYTIEGFLEKY